MSQFVKLTPEMLAERHTVIDTKTLEALPGNPNRGNQAAITESLDTFGQFDGIVVWRGTVLIGNHRVHAAGGDPLAGYDLSDLDLPEAQRIGMALASNRTARLGYDDPVDLLALLDALDEETAVSAGFDDGHAAQLRAMLDGLDVLDLGDPPELPDIAESLLLLVSPETGARWGKVRKQHDSDDACLEALLDG